MTNSWIADVGQAAIAGRGVDRSTAERLAALDGDDLYDLFYWANRVRLAHFGRAVSLCSIGASKIGGCSEDCRFCAQSARYRDGVATGNPALADVSRTPGEKLVAAGLEAASHGASAFGIVASGRGPSDAEIEQLAGPIGQLSRQPGLAVCASLGHLTAAQADRLRSLGLRRYHHNLETSRRFYPQIVSTHSFDERVATLRAAKAAGLTVCSGGLFNLGEDWADRVDMALTLREIGADMVPLNFLNPIPGTPMGDRPPMTPNDVLKVIAIYRLILPTRGIKVAGGRDVNLRDLQSWMFYCGANSCMVGNYLTTFGRPVELDHAMIRDLGLHCG